MKYLKHYIKEATTKLLNKHGVFFAFSDKQLNESKKEGVKYMSLGMGMICPKENADEFVKSYSNIIDLGIKLDLEENTKVGVIKRELANHEAYYTGDLYQTVEYLKGYGITRDEIAKVYNQDKEKRFAKM